MFVTIEFNPDAEDFEVTGIFGHRYDADKFLAPRKAPTNLVMGWDAFVSTCNIAPMLRPLLERLIPATGGVVPMIATELIGERPHETCIDRKTGRCVPNYIGIPVECSQADAPPAGESGPEMFIPRPPIELPRF